MTAEQDSNPFSSRFVRPGAIAYRFGDERTAAQCVEQLAGQAWRGQIVGPHGTGKSTLLRTLIPAIEATGRSVDLVALAAGQTWWRPSAQQTRRWNAQTLVVVDGYERLNRWSRWRLRALCWQRRAGLLVTAHQNVGLPTLLQTAVSPEIARLIVRDLQREGETLVNEQDVAQVLEARQGNLREALFDLYDLYELRRRRSPS